MSNLTTCIWLLLLDNIQAFTCFFSSSIHNTSELSSCHSSVIYFLLFFSAFCMLWLWAYLLLTYAFSLFDLHFLPNFDHYFLFCLLTLFFITPFYFSLLFTAFVCILFSSLLFTFLGFLRFQIFNMLCHQTLEQQVRLLCSFSCLWALLSCLCSLYW